MAKKKILMFAFLSLIMTLATLLPTLIKAQGPTTKVPTAPTKAIEWKMQDCFPSGLIYKVGGEYFAKKVTELSGGRLKVTYMTAGAIVGPFEVLDAVHKGILDAGAGPTHYFLGRLPPGATFFTNHPGTMGINERLAWFYEGGGIKLNEAIFKAYNIGLVRPVFAVGPENFAWSNKPIRNLDDFKKLKFRTTGLWAQVLARLGVSVVMLPGGEVFSALERGVIDATEYGSPAMDLQLGVHEITKYMILPGIQAPSTTLNLIVNKNSWERLPDDLKPLVEAAAQEATFWSLRYVAVEDAKAMKKFKEKGIKIERLDRDVQAEIVKVVEGVCDEEAAKAPTFAEIWKSFQDFRKNWKYREEVDRFE